MIIVMINIINYNKDNSRYLGAVIAHAA